MDIAAWLDGLGLGQYKQAFRDNDIDGEVLRGLTADDLRELGVASIGHRRRLLDAAGTPDGTSRLGAPTGREDARR
jgi:SAM domain (Sterile alpha motif)